MSITILLFGQTANLVGNRRVEREVGQSATVDSVVKAFVEEHPALGSGKLLVAVNEAYVSADELVHDGDEVAIFTPVSGG